MTRDDEKPVRANLPKSLVEDFEQIYDYHGAKTDMVERAFRNAVESEGDAIQRKMEEKREELNDAKAERREINARIETLEDELNELQRRFDETKTSDAVAEGRLSDLVDMVESGKRVVPGDNAVLSKVAQTKGISEDAAVELIRDRANMELPNEAFQRKKPTETDVNWRKCLEPGDDRWKA